MLVYFDETFGSPPNTLSPRALVVLRTINPMNSNRMSLFVEPDSEIFTRNGWALVTESEGEYVVLYENSAVSAAIKLHSSSELVEKEMSVYRSLLSKVLGVETPSGLIAPVRWYPKGTGQEVDNRVPQVPSSLKVYPTPGSDCMCALSRHPCGTKYFVIPGVSS